MAATPYKIREICWRAAARAEQQAKLPAHILAAIALAESGRWQADLEEKIAWPWTVYAEGRGRYHPNKQSAIREVRSLLARGVRNIDVGCMQVNLGYHGAAFANLEAALDPDRNAAVAARLLKQRHAETRSWSLAISHYHSRNAKHGGPYRQRVLKLWSVARHRAWLRQRAAMAEKVVAMRARRPDAK